METDGTIERRCCAAVAAAVRLSPRERELHLLPVTVHAKAVVLIPKVHGVQAADAGDGEALSSWSVGGGD